MSVRCSLNEASSKTTTAKVVFKNQSLHLSKDIDSEACHLKINVKNMIRANVVKRFMIVIYKCL
jgi:hypothetical protein